MYMTQEDLINKQNADIFSVVKTGLPPINITPFQFITQGLDPMEDEAKRVVEESLANQQKILADRIKNAEQQQANTSIKGDKISINQGATANNNANSGEYDLDGIQRWMDKSAGGKSPLTAKQIYDSAKKYDVPFELALAQAQQEGNFGKDKNAKPYRTKNLWNVGNVDSGAINNQNSFEQGLDTYMSLFSRKYGNSKDQERLLNNFTNKSGNRYASDVNYEKSLRSIIDKNIAPYRRTTSTQTQQPAPKPIAQTVQQSSSGNFNLDLGKLSKLSRSDAKYVSMNRITPNESSSQNDWIEGGARITSGYQSRPIPSGTAAYNVDSRGQQFNLGVDLAPNKGAGAKVMSGYQTQGEVVQVNQGSNNRGYGNQVVVKYAHSNGMVEYREFNHLQGADVKVGQKLNKGDYIGRVGATGNVTGVHLDMPSYVIDSKLGKVYQPPLSK